MGAVTERPRPDCPLLRSAHPLQIWSHPEGKSPEHLHTPITRRVDRECSTPPFLHGRTKTPRQHGVLRFSDVYTHSPASRMYSSRSFDACFPLKHWARDRLDQTRVITLCRAECGYSRSNL